MSDNDNNNHLHVDDDSCTLLTLSTNGSDDSSSGKSVKARCTSNKKETAKRSENLIGGSVLQKDMENVANVFLGTVWDGVDYAYDENPTEVKSYRIHKFFPKEKVGLTFSTNEGIVTIRDIEIWSRFQLTGLQVGSRVISINGKPVPTKPKKLVQLLKKARNELVIEAETPREKHDTKTRSPPEWGATEGGTQKLWYTYWSGRKRTAM